MTEFEKMVTGQLFNGADPSVNNIREQATRLLQELNHNTVIVSVLKPVASC